jgi:hypothetical protein
MFFPIVLLLTIFKKQFPNNSKQETWFWSVSLSAIILAFLYNGATEDGLSSGMFVCLVVAALFQLYLLNKL